MMNEERTGPSRPETRGAARSWLSWRNLSVGRKIGLTIGTLIVLSIFVGGFAYNGFTCVVDRVAKADDANRLIKLAREALRQEKNYIIRRDEESRMLVVDSIQRVYDQIDETRKKFRDPVNIAQIETVRAETESFEQSFSAWVELAERQKALENGLVQEARMFVGECEEMRRDQKEKLKASLREAAPVRADRLWKADSANRLIKVSLMARLAQLKYMAGKDAAYVDENHNAMREIYAICDELKSRFHRRENKDEVGNVITAAKAYQAAFDSWVAVQRELEAHKRALITAGKKQVDECNALRGSQKEQMEAEFAGNAELAKLQRRVEKADDANRMLKLVIESAVARRDFMILPTEQNLARIHDICQELLAQADKTKAKMLRQPNVEQVESVIAATKTYLDRLDKYAKGRIKQSQEAEVMVATASDFITECEAIRADQKKELAQSDVAALADVMDRLAKADDANRLIKFSQVLRIQEKNYMLRKDKDALIDIEATLGSVHELCEDLASRARTEATRRRIAAILASATKYKKEFDSWAVMAQKQEEQDSVMVLAARAMLSECEALRADQKRQLEESVRAATIAILTVLTVALLGGLTMGVVITRGIARPLRGAVEIAGAIAEGNFTHSLEINQRDEIGDLAGSLNTMSENLNGLVGKVKESSVQLQSTTTELAATSHEQEATAASFGSSANEIAAAVSQISATGNELVGTMKAVNQIAVETSELATTGRVGLQDMETTMRQLDDATAAIADKLAIINEKAANITGVVTAITKVADQTNLLSVNAAIEAEKAGEYGVGFLVVAREIRRLADQTAAATLDIEQMVQQMVSAVSTGVMEMDRFADQVRRSVKNAAAIQEQMSQIIEQVNTSTAGFERINLGMQSQSEGADQINEAMGQLTENAARTTQATREYAAAAADLQTAIASLNSSVATFQLKS